MGRLNTAFIALALAVAMAFGLAACGGGSDADLLPGSTAGEITSNLDKVEALANEGDCVGASDAAEAVSLQVEDLGGVDTKLKQALSEGAARLNEVVASCEETTTTEEEETVPSIAPAEEPEEVEKKPTKPEKPKQEEEKSQSEEAGTTPTLPPQAAGEAKGHEKQEEAAPVEAGGGAPSGGVGPSEPAQGDGVEGPG
ncbi:MAG TPA: hypothetical protein VFI03_03150 [Solirubrobacterales bacterium]|nr:hypothetical protein [Solirubrobacterales bacterium]